MSIKVNIPPEIKEAKDEDDVVFEDPKKNFASGSPCIKIFRVHLVFGSRLQSRSLVQVPGIEKAS